MKPNIWNGKPITKPGIYVGVPMDVYHSATVCGDEPSVSSSILRKLFLRSPAHYWARSVYNPDGKSDDEEETDALILGRAAHHVLLGEKFFADHYIVRPTKLEGDDGYKPWNGNRLCCKEWLYNHAAFTILSPDQAEQIRGMALSLSNYPLVQEGVLNGHIECSMFWRDPRTKIWLKARPDVIPADSGIFVDVKKTRSTDYIEMQAALDNYGYFMQAALIFEGAKQLDIPAEAFVFLFVENDYPHDVRDVTLNDQDIVLGAAVNTAMLDKFARCWRAGDWPGPANNIIGGSIELSDRARERVERRLKFEKSNAELSNTFSAASEANVIPWRSRLNKCGEGFAGVAVVDAALTAAGAELASREVPPEVRQQNSIASRKALGRRPGRT